MMLECDLSHQCRGGQSNGRRCAQCMLDMRAHRFDNVICLVVVGLLLLLLFGGGGGGVGVADGCDHHQWLLSFCAV